MRCIGVFYSKPFENFIAPHTTEYRYKSDFLFFDQQLYRQFNKQYYDQLFMVAGRNITVNYSSLFEKELSPTLKSMKDLFSINELIMTEFIEKVSNLQRIFRGLRGFRGIVIAVFSRVRGNKILERLTVKDSNTPHSCDYRYMLCEIEGYIWVLGQKELPILLYV